MPRASVIVAKYNLDSYFYILQDLELIVPIADKADDKNKKKVKNHQLGQDQSPRPQKKEKLMNHLRTPFLKMLPFLVTMKMTIIILLLRGKEVKPPLSFIFTHLVFTSTKKGNNIHNRNNFITR